MSNELPILKLDGQTIDYVELITPKKGFFKNIPQTSVSGKVTFSQSTTDAHSTIKVKIANERHDLRKLMESFAKKRKTPNGEGTITAMIIYPNNPAEPLIFNGGAIEDLPELQEGNKGSTEYMFMFNAYSGTL